MVFSGSSFRLLFFGVKLILLGILWLMKVFCWLFIIMSLVILVLVGIFLFNVLGVVWKCWVFLFSL